MPDYLFARMGTGFPPNSDAETSGTISGPILIVSGVTIGSTIGLANHLYDTET